MDAQQYKYRIFSKKGEPQHLLTFLRENQLGVIEIQELDEHHLIKLDLDLHLAVEIEQDVEYFPHGQEKELENWLNKSPFEMYELIKLHEGYIVHVFNPPKERWYISLLKDLLDHAPIVVVLITIFVYLYFSEIRSYFRAIIE